MDVTEKIIGGAIEVHRRLGPGLLESVYQTCLIYEIKRSGLAVEQEKPLPLVYKDIKLDCGYRLDLLVEGQVIVEIKSVKEVLAVHFSQILSYLRLANHEVGLLINFNVPLLTDGLHRVVNGYNPKNH